MAEEIKKNMVSANFDIRQFVDPQTFKDRGEASIGLINRKLVDIAEFIHEKTGLLVTINNWHLGGQFKESGLRNPNTKTGAKLSQHKLGNAIDVKCSGFTGVEWYAFVKLHAKELFDLGVRRIEDKSLAKTWLHIDCKEHGKKVIQVVDLTKVTEEIKF